MNYINGPRLIRTHKDGSTSGRIYKAGVLETIGEYVIKTYSLAFDALYYTSPVIAFYTRYYGNVKNKDVISYLPYAVAFGVVLMLAIVARAIGRKLDPSYVKFSHVFNTFYFTPTIASRRELDKFDFDFNSYPIDFDCIGHTVTLEATPNEYAPNYCTYLPVQLISFLAVHTFGRRLVFPGSTSFVRSLIGPTLVYGRGKLVEDFNGRRVRIRTGDTNDIDCMYIDRRPTKQVYGDTLIICCEGNSGFYELGTMRTPLEAGYSTIGWNHPGFGNSTGVPWPESEATAVDAVMQYAIQKLGFTVDNIGVFAWSIGGFTASWLAQNYPDIKQVTIDASFDSLGPLAMTKMPKCLGSLVGFAIHKYLNLNNAEQLIKYSGPLLLIRRRKDEMISTKGNNVAYNRTNILLTAVLKQRYPYLTTEDTMRAFNVWVAYSRTNQLEYEKQFNINDNTILPFITSFSFPSTIGKAMSEENKARCLIFVGSKFMVEYDSSHCTQLPGDMFTLPWNPERQSTIGLQLKSTMKSLSSTTKSKIDSLMGLKRRPTKSKDLSDVGSTDLKSVLL